MGSHCQINQVSPPMNGGSQRLTYEELHIILYSRLLLPIHKHSDDGVHCLSPGHFLVGCSLQTLPDYDHDHNDTKLPLLNRWSLCQALSQNFWCKRSREYLQQLQKLRKWRSPSRNVLPGDIVLIKSRLHLLAYGQVRADVPGKRWKDSSGYHPDSVRLYLQPITKLVMLLSQEDSKDVSSFGGRDDWASKDFPWSKGHLPSKGLALPELNSILDSEFPLVYCCWIILIVSNTLSPELFSVFLWFLWDIHAIPHFCNTLSLTSICIWPGAPYFSVNEASQSVHLVLLIPL